MDDLGMDYTVLYPTEGLVSPPRFEDEEVRRVSCRALNAFHADIYREYADRMTPVAVIPVHTPQEGIEELEYAVNQLLGLSKIFYDTTTTTLDLSDVKRNIRQSEMYFPWRVRERSQKRFLRAH
jgi:hypothetical protein